MEIFLMDSQSLKKLFGIPVIVAALGYFVDIYDLLLFSIVRIPSLSDPVTNDWFAGGWNFMGRDGR